MGIILDTQADNLTLEMGITPVYPNVIEDSSKGFTGSAIVAGQCLALSTNATTGETILIPATSATPVYGLAKQTKNATVNEVYDRSYGMWGSNKVTACVFGMYEVKNFSFTVEDGSTVDFVAHAVASNATVGSILGANDSGCVAVVPSASCVSAFGTLTDVKGDTIQVKIGF